MGARQIRRAQRSSAACGFISFEYPRAAFTASSQAHTAFLPDAKIPSHSLPGMWSHALHGVHAQVEFCSGLAFESSRDFLCLPVVFSDHRPAARCLLRENPTGNQSTFPTWILGYHGLPDLRLDSQTVFWRSSQCRSFPVQNVMHFRSKAGFLYGRSWSASVFSRLVFWPCSPDGIQHSARNAEIDGNRSRPVRITSY